MRRTAAAPGLPGTAKDEIALAEIVQNREKHHAHRERDVARRVQAELLNEARAQLRRDGVGDEVAHEHVQDLSLIHI